MQLLPHSDLHAYTDGAARAGCFDGGTGITFYFQGADCYDNALPAGSITCSFRCELVGMKGAFDAIAEGKLPEHTLRGDTLILRTDSQSGIKRLVAGPTAQTERLPSDAWNAILRTRRTIRRIFVVFCPGHAGVVGNDRADFLVRVESRSSAAQEWVPIDIRSADAAVKRVLKERWILTVKKGGS
eukprot:gene16969-5814_t